ncbi:MSMEG_0570 family nitrogen starvation response protein [Jatrophihabitans sp. YIM 134969]
MPEVHVRLRWPDGVVQRVYSPSLVVTERFEAGTSCAVADLLPTMGEALAEASDRVRAAYGFPCSRAAASWQQVQARAAAVGGTGEVVVEAFER